MRGVLCRETQQLITIVPISMLIICATMACCYYEHAKRSETSEVQGSRDIMTTAALHCRCVCPGVSRDDKSSWKPDRFERAVARKHEAPIFPTQHRTRRATYTPAGLVSCSFFLFLLVPRCLTLFLVAPPRFLTDTSWGNDKSSRCTDGPQFGERFYLTAATAGRIFRRSTLRAR